MVSAEKYPPGRFGQRNPATAAHDSCILFLKRPFKSRPGQRAYIKKLKHANSLPQNKSKYKCGGNRSELLPPHLSC